MSEFDVDVLVIGAGNAGFAAAGVAHEAGLSVRIVESGEVGGTCALRGCVPKKVLVAAAETLDVIRRAGTHHINIGTPTLDWGALVAREQSFVSGVPEQFEASLEERGIKLIRGAAKFVGPNAVEIGGVVHLAAQIVVATGSSPRVLPIDGFEYIRDSDHMLKDPRLPDSIAFIGGGVIGLELGHVLARAGTLVTILEAAPRLLSRHDADQIAELQRATDAIGIDTRTSVRVHRVRRRADGRFEVDFESHGKEHTIEVAAVANAAGRTANLDLDLAAAGIASDGRSLALSPGLRSLDNPSVYFAGDAIPGRPQLSPVATYEGKIAGSNLVQGTDEPTCYANIPSAVFTVPTVARVGLTEEEARSAGIAMEVKVNDMRSWRSARTYGEEVAWAKVLIAEESGLIIGAHLVGHGAGETIHAFAAAMSAGKKAIDFKSTVYAYPTFHADLKHLV